MLKSIDNLDKILLSDQMSFYKKSKKNLIQIMVIIIFSTMCGLCCDFTLRIMTDGIVNASKLMMFNLIEFHKNLSILQFHYWLYLLRQRFDFVNNQLVSLDQSAVLQYPLNFTQIHSLRCAHFRLSMLAATLDRVHGFQLLLKIISLFLKVLTQLYMVVTFLQIRNEETTFKVVTAMKGVWAVLNTLVLARLATMCSATKRKHTKAQFLLQKMLTRRDMTDKFTADEVERFSRQVANTNLTFTAFELFEIDKALLLTAAANVTTYLVILIQIQ
jgi:hypothetical protein